MEKKDKVVVYRNYHKTGYKFPDELLDQTYMSIGSQWDKETGEPLRPLSFEEEEKYLPDLLSVKAEDTNFRNAAYHYWIDFEVTVPPEGLALNVKVNDNGDPVNKKDYIKYRFLQKHRNVAFTEEEKSHLYNNNGPDFYMVNYAEEFQKEISQSKKESRAVKRYATLADATDADSKATIDYILVFTKDINSKPVEKMDEDEKMLALHNIYKNHMERFLEVVEDDNLRTKAFAQHLIDNGIIVRSGNDYYHEDVYMGDTMDALVKYIQNDKNSADVAKLKSKLQQFSNLNFQSGTDIKRSTKSKASKGKEQEQKLNESTDSE